MAHYQARLYNVTVTDADGVTTTALKKLSIGQLVMAICLERAVAKEKEFDYRSGAMAIFDQLKAELKEDGLEEVASEQLAALGAVLEMDKERFLRLQKDEILPFIEEEIAVRYYYQRGGVLMNMRYDTQLQQALTLPLINIEQ